MKRNKIVIFLILGLMISTITLVNLDYTNAETTDRYFNYTGTFTDRFTNDPIVGAKLTFYVHTIDDTLEEHKSYLGTVYTSNTGFFTISGKVEVYVLDDYPLFSTFIDFQKTGYISEYYQYDDGCGQIKLNHEQFGWTPEYQCDIYGYVKQRMGLLYYPISGVTVQLWGVDEHLVNFLCESTTTNSQGYYLLDYDFENPYPNPAEVVAEYYYIKVWKLGYPTVIKTVYPYPYPNGNILMSTVYYTHHFVP